MLGNSRDIHPFSSFTPTNNSMSQILPFTPFRTILTIGLKEVHDLIKVKEQLSG